MTRHGAEYEKTDSCRFSSSSREFSLGPDDGNESWIVGDENLQAGDGWEGYAGADGRRPGADAASPRKHAARTAQEDGGDDGKAGGCHVRGWRDAHVHQP